MRKTLYSHLLLLALLCGICCACGSDDNTPEGPTLEKLEPQERPTDWVAVTVGIDLQSSMTADVGIDLTPLGYQYETDSLDLAAAFIDGTCRAVSAPHIDPETGKTVFALTIKKLASEETGKDVWLKFYSAKLHHIFTSKSAIKYEGERRYGSAEEPYKPEWNIK